MASKAQAGRGTQLLIGGVTGGNSTTFTPIAEITQLTIGDITVDIEEISNFDSGFWKEKLGTMGDPGGVDWKGNYVGNDGGLIAYNAALATGDDYDFKVVLPKNKKLAQAANGDTFAFSAIATKGGGLDVSPKGPVTTSGSLTITGARNFTAGS